MTPNNPPGLPKDGKDKDIEDLLYRFGLNLCVPVSTRSSSYSSRNLRSPKPENLNSLSEFYDEMYDEEGLPFFDAPGA